jgi:hypothetical protein
VKECDLRIPKFRRSVALPDYEKSKDFADSLEPQFQPINVPSVPTVIEMVDVALESYTQTLASKPKLTTLDGV